MNTRMRTKWSLALLLALCFAAPVFAHANGGTGDTTTSGATTGDVSEETDVYIFDEPDAEGGLYEEFDETQAIPPDSTSGATTESEEVIIEEAPAASTGAAPVEPVSPAVAETRGERPKTGPSTVRLNPVAGAASFTTNSRATLENFDEGFTAGVYADFGRGAWAFQTGVIALSVQGDTSLGNFNVDSWGIPLNAKYNFTGNPNQSIYLKAGVLPFQPNGTDEDFNVLGVAGLGGAIPLFHNTALTLEATYNRVLDDSTSLRDYQGVSLLAGLQFGL